MTGNAGRPGASGADVARLFHTEAVAPILAGEFPRLRYAAGRLGSGSDVLGLDDAMSRDHDWGCRLTLLMDQADAATVPAVRDRLAAQLPDSWRGRPVRFDTTWDSSEVHRVEVATVRDFARSRLAADPLAGLTAVDWLMLTGQGVLEVTAGPVFTNQTTELSQIRESLRWYPAEVDRYLLAAGWLLVIRGLRAGVKDPDLARLPAEVGSIEQWCGDVELLARPEQRIALAAAYRAWLQAT